MNDAKHSSGEMNTRGGGVTPPCTGSAPDALPEVSPPLSPGNSQTGVSTRNALYPPRVRQEKAPTHWYALRATYGREKKSYEYLVEHNIEAYYPTISVTKIIDGKRKTVVQSRFPNIFFARGTEEEIKAFVYDNINLPHLRFYYRHTHEGTQITKTPLVVPDKQMDSLKIICQSENEDILIIPSEVNKFRAGQKVRVKKGQFEGVEGVVGRYQGQQRVGIIIGGMLTACTAYIPTAFLEET